MPQTGQNIYKTWSQIKAFIIAPKNLELQYHEYEYYYKVFVVEAGVEYFTELWKDASQVTGIDVIQNDLDLADFEDNYKAGANQPIREDVTVENEIDVIAQVANIATEETLIQISGALSALGTGLATEATVSAILNTFGQESGTTFLANLIDLKNNVQSQLDVLLSSRASESTSQSILNAIGEGSGTNLLDALQNLTIDVDTSGLATEATLIQVRDYLDTLETKLQSIIDKLDVNLSTRASESTVVEIRDTIGQESGSTVLSKLQAIWSKLVELFNTGVAKVKIWDGINTVTVTSDGDKKRLDVSTGLQDNDTGASVTIDLEHHSLHEGKIFLTWHKRNGLDKNVKNTYLIQVAENNIHLHISLNTDLKSQLHIYENPIITNNGTLLQSFNRNRASVISPATQFFNLPTSTSLGTLISQIFIPGSNQSATSILTSDWILKANTKYIVDIESLANGNEYSIHFNWIREE